MALPKLGYLCLSENPTAEEGRALLRQFVLVREADRMGYDDIWLGEHHDDRAWPTGAATALLGHLAAVTSKARIGSMVLMPALRDAVQLAEDVATIDLLAKGRFELGVASGAAHAKAPCRPAASTLRRHGCACARRSLSCRTCWPASPCPAPTRPSR
jgi:alkanesulfonate monooxygenase SsuD/methylene tetrahydromethanopterin reductase-like flavin-dependent oxidoreductase (luciferase family)